MPVTAFAAFALSFALERFLPVSAQDFWILMLAVMAAIAAPRSCLADGYAQRWVLVAAAGLVFMSVHLMVQGGYDSSGVWKVLQRAGELAICLSVMSSGVSAANLVRAFGAASGIALIASLVMTALVEPNRGHTYGFGFGHANYLANTAGPALIAWTALACAERGRKRLGREEFAVMLFGWIALAVLVYGAHCRGVAVAALAAASWVGLNLCLRTRPRLLRGAIAASALLVVGGLAWLFLSDVSPARDQRISLYRGALELAANRPLFGHGPYGAVAMSAIDGENARHFTAFGEHCMHAHNEFLDAAIDGGIIGFAVLSLLVLGVVWRVARICDRSVRLALQAMGLAMLVHACTDNTYGTVYGGAWCAVAVGVMLGAPSATARWRCFTSLTSMRSWQWLLALPALGAALNMTASMFVARDATLAVHGNTIERVLNPGAINAHVLYAWTDANRQGFHGFAQRIERTLERRFGSIGAFRSLATQTALVRRDERAMASSLVQALDDNPMSLQCYQRLEWLMTNVPDVASQLPPRCSVRLAYITARDGLPRPDIGVSLESIEVAADLHAALHWLVMRGTSWAEISAPMERLVRRYGDIDGVALLPILAIKALGGKVPEWIDRHFTTMCRSRTFAYDVARVLSELDDPREAEALRPYVARLYPEILDECERGTMSVRAEADARYHFVRNAVVRYWSLLRTTNGGRGLDSRRGLGPDHESPNG